MKKRNYFTLAASLILTAQLSFGQKEKYVDWVELCSTQENKSLQAALDKLSNNCIDRLSSTAEYKSAQAELDKCSMSWQKEIEAKYAEIGTLKQAYERAAVSLNEQMKKKRGNEITKKEKELKALKEKRFGLGGDLFKRRNILIKDLAD